MAILIAQGFGALALVMIAFALALATWLSLKADDSDFAYLASFISTRWFTFTRRSTLGNLSIVCATIVYHSLLPSEYPIVVAGVLAFLLACGTVLIGALTIRRLRR